MPVAIPGARGCRSSAGIGAPSICIKIFFPLLLAEVKVKLSGPVLVCSYRHRDLLNVSKFGVLPPKLAMIHTDTTIQTPLVLPAYEAARLAQTRRGSGRTAARRIVRS